MHNRFAGKVVALAVGLATNVAPVALIAAGLALQAPRPASAAQETWICEGGEGQLCEETTACAGFPWNNVCTTKYKYWRKISGGLG